GRGGRGAGTGGHAARPEPCSCCRPWCPRPSGGCPAGPRRPPAPCSSAVGGQEIRMFRDTRVHVVIPAYNVGDRIGAVLRDMPRLVDAVTVVNDGSTDRTAAAGCGGGDPRVTPLEGPRNGGMAGGTVRRLRDPPSPPA